MAVDALHAEDIAEYTAASQTDEEVELTALSASFENVEEDELDQLKTAREDYEIINGFPHYPSGYRVDNGQIEIFERIGFNDRVGPTYLAMAADGKELVLRVGTPDACQVRMEAAFLCKAEAERSWQLFSQVHSVWQEDDFYFLALYFRGGPTLQQCFEFSKNRFSHGTAGRLGLDAFKILRGMHRMEFIVRRLELDIFHLDAASRHLFLADLSSIMKDVNKSTVEAQRQLGVNWTGCPLFAPMAWHREQSITERDVLESWSYMLIFMATGTLAWHGVAFDEIQWLKAASTSDERLFSGLPSEYHKIYEIITSEDSSAPVEASEYDEIESLLERIYKEHGSVVDEDDNFDFERDPTEEELPRFVLERDDANPAEADNGPAPEDN